MLSTSGLLPILTPEPDERFNDPGTLIQCVAGCHAGEDSKHKGAAWSRRVDAKERHVSQDHGLRECDQHRQSRQWLCGRAV